METNRITLPQEDKSTTTVYANLADVSSPIGSVLLLHDLAEHHGRFDDFARVLNSKGYDTYSYDHRGHGAGIRYEELGFIADENGYELLISDALHVLKYIKKTNRGRKLILFGQGIGALIAICVIQTFDDIDACILCSAPNPPFKTIRSTLTAAKFIRFRKNQYYRSVYLEKKFTEYKSFSKISNRTAYDWISRDNQLVGSYISDPLCHFTGTVSFYIDILNLMDEAVARANLKQIRGDLPILLIAGSHDPVCDYGNDTADLFDTFQRYHFNEVDCTIYEECRHDLLHETNNVEIIRDILEWISKALDNRRLKAAAILKASKKQRKGNKNHRTAAEAARSALGYASDVEDSSLKGSIQADDVGVDDDFLDDMGYFSGRSGYNSSEFDEEFDDFIIMDDDEEDSSSDKDEQDTSGSSGKKTGSSSSKDTGKGKKGKGKKKSSSEDLKAEDVSDSDAKDSGSKKSKSKSKKNQDNK